MVQNQSVKGVFAYTMHIRQLKRIYFEGSGSLFPVLSQFIDAAASRDGERSAVAVGTSDFTARVHSETGTVRRAKEK